MSDFKFCNLFGSLYIKGDILFTNEGHSIIVPVGNRITLYDLKLNRASAFDTNNRKNIKRIALSPDDNLLLTVDCEGHCICSSLKRLIPIHYFNFKDNVKSIKFSPCGNYISACVGKLLHLYHTPIIQPDFRPFKLFKKISGFPDTLVTHDYSDDSKLIAVACSNMMLRMIAVDKNEFPFSLPLLRAYKFSIVNVFFEKETYDLFAIDKKGFLIKWNFDTTENRWNKEPKVDFSVETASVTKSAFNKTTSILVIAFNNGVFTIIDHQTSTKIQQLSLQQCKINLIVINSTSDWIGIASSSKNSVIVWDYKNESYIMKQHGATLNMKCACYSPNGVQIATGSEDGKLKIWDTFSGFCFITFEEHKTQITGIKFSSNGQFFVSSSFDGTCRAFDMNRYRNFRIFVAPNPIQFTCIDLDYANELVCAGSNDDFNIYVWSVSNGHLLEIIHGHTSPISGVTFILETTKLASCSWDKALRISDVMEPESNLFNLNFNSELLAIASHPGRSLLAVCSTRAHIHFIDCSVDKIIGSIQGQKDLGLARGVNDVMTAESSLAYRYFNSICFSSDGELLFACGKSKYICIYDTTSFALIDRIQTTINQSFDNILARLNSKNMTEAGPKEALINLDSDEEEYLTEKYKIPIPGSIKNDVSTRKTKPEYQLLQLCGCPTGNSIACVSSDGLLIYSKDEKFLFDPINIDSEITTKSIEQLLSENKIEKALMYSLKMNESDLICKCLERISYSDIKFVSSRIPPSLALSLLEVISRLLDENITPHLEFYVRWCNSLLMAHALTFKTYYSQSGTPKLNLLRRIQKSLHRYSQDIGQLCEENIYHLKYLMKISENSN